MAGIFAAELGLALITDLVAGIAGIEALLQHQAPCLLEAELLLVLQRAHRRDGLEMVMQRGNAHADAACEVFDAQRPGIMLFQPGDRTADLVRLALRCRHLSELGAVRPEQQPVKEFLFDQRQEHRNVVRSVEEPQQPKRRVLEIGCKLAHRHAARRACGFRSPVADGVEQRRNPRRIDLESHAEIGFFGRRERYLRENRQVDRGQKVVGGSVNECFFAEHDTFGPLNDDRNTRLVSGAVQLRRNRMPVNAEAGYARLVVTVRSGDPGNNIDHFLTRRVLNVFHIQKSFQTLGYMRLGKEHRSVTSERYRKWMIFAGSCKIIAGSN
ncbi:conserved hypothetical protein [Sinorhizobium medicae]|uniref:Uncharacterized protein n=1 Tax=Sinorhizobium medicae TaxID=110321 RepID=A0A508WWW1_9HYPH|nr:conserved hypothetical protein [Sinorhizobium medicae]